MSSFFEKLIGAETAPSEKAEKIKKPATKKPLKLKPMIQESEPEPEEEKEEIEPTLPEPRPIKSVVSQSSDKSEVPMGKLAIDVFQTDEEVVVQSTIAGVKPENVEVVIENGIVKISGSREKTQTVTKDDYVLQECHWGSFSRQFVLPSEVDAARAEASLKDGILTVRIPRILKEKTTRLTIR
jgi:HSP20 family protein